MYLYIWSPLDWHFKTFMCFPNLGIKFNVQPGYLATAEESLHTCTYTLGPLGIGIEKLFYIFRTKLHCVPGRHLQPSLNFANKTTA